MITKTLLILLFSSSIYANIANPFLSPMGERESFMSNTGVANTKSLGSFFFNPGALSTIERTSFSLSGAIYSYYSFTLETGAVIGDSKGSIEGNGFSAIPGTMIISKKVPKGILAFGVLTPSELKTETKENWFSVMSDVGGPTKAEAILSTENYEVWFGASYSRRINSKLGLGVSIFGYNHYDYSLSTIDQKYENDSTKSKTYISRQTLDSYGILGIFGAYYEERNYTLGLSIKTPSLTLYDRAEYYSTFSDNTSGTMVNTKIELDDVETGFYRPGDISLGYSYHSSENFKFLFDLSFQLPAKMTALKTNMVSNEIRVETKLTPRFNTGLEINHSEKLISMYGISYNPSTIKKQSVNKLSSEADAYTFSGGVLFIENNLSTGIGVNLLYGKGKSKFSRNSNDAELNIYNGGVQILSGYHF